MTTWANNSKGGRHRTSDASGFTSGCSFLTAVHVTRINQTQRRQQRRTSCVSHLLHPPRHAAAAHAPRLRYAALISASVAEGDTSSTAYKSPAPCRLARDMAATRVCAAWHRRHAPQQHATQPVTVSHRRPQSLGSTATCVSNRSRHTGTLHYMKTEGQRAMQAARFAAHATHSRWHHQPCRAPSQRHCRGATQTADTPLDCSPGHGARLALARTRGVRSWVSHDSSAQTTTNITQTYHT